MSKRDRLPGRNRVSGRNLQVRIVDYGLTIMLKRLKTITLIINAKAIVIASLAVLSTFH